MTNKKKVMPWWGWVTWILAIVLGCIAYFRLPAQVPSYATSAGKPVFLIVYEPAIMLVIILSWHVLWRIDPKKRNYEFFWPTYRYIGGVVVVCIGLIYLMVLGHLLHLRSMRFALTAYGIMFMLIANVLPRLRPNWLIGIRTPWTLSSEESWSRTHRLGGQLGIPIGILIIILAWISPINKTTIVTVIVPVLLWVLTMSVASYFYAKKE